MKPILTTLALLLVSVLGASMASARGFTRGRTSHGGVRTTSSGGDWYAPSTWRDATVPSTNTDLVSAHISAPVTIETGTVNLADCVLYPSTNNPVMHIGPLAHVNMRGSLSSAGRTAMAMATVNCTIEGSVMLQRGAMLYGDTLIDVKGGYVYGTGRRVELHTSGGRTAGLRISDGGMFYVRQILTQYGAKIEIDDGEIRLDGIEAEGKTQISTTNGKFMLSRITSHGNCTFILHEGGELLLTGQWDATKLATTYPALKIQNADIRLAFDELAYTPGTGRYAKYTRITPKP